MNWELILPIILQLIGVGVIIAEIIIPSMGMLALIAISLFAYSLYTVFTEVSPTVGMTMLVADLVIVPVLLMIGIKMLARSPATLKAQLSKEEGYSSQRETLKKLKNRKGRAATDLRPAGGAVIDGNRTDVITRGEYIEKGTEVIVISVGSNQVVVRALAADE